MTTNYHKSFLNKIVSLFNGVVVSSLIHISDEDGYLISNVCFFEVDYNRVVGFYINGANPLVTSNHINEFDDFNLYSMYETLTEVKSGVLPVFRVEHMKAVFHPEYDELVALFLSSADFSISLLVVFSIDEIYVHVGCNQGDYIEVIKNDLLQFKEIDFLIFQKNTDDTYWSDL